MNNKMKNKLILGKRYEIIYRGFIYKDAEYCNCKGNNYPHFHIGEDREILNVNAVNTIKPDPPLCRFIADGDSSFCKKCEFYKRKWWKIGR